ncbi:hypothetical protein INN71_16505 [Nocardioides sp. ChNu-153]|uniref:hypothetical protein n=1 Tax=unclassified Nocardioides TaxID=2615069 RepID=UPI002405835A|nr:MULTISPECIES: hypothetical protein [unclassified Nocardioides]MDF9717217.1 hypothetical protein [Nocardioides sp. ChNu-99]MDN7122987.1 hypothetical protein [Nocardioides sp. ChNu-153]
MDIGGWDVELRTGGRSWRVVARRCDAVALEVDLAPGEGVQRISFGSSYRPVVPPGRSLEGIFSCSTDDCDPHVVLTWHTEAGARETRTIALEQV